MQVVRDIDQRNKDRGPRTGNPGQMTQDRGPRTEDPGGGPYSVESEDPGQRTRQGTQDRGPRTEDPTQKTQDRGPSTQNVQRIKEQGLD